METVRAKRILVGANFRFGYQQAGNVDLLTRLGKEHGFDVEIMAAAEISGRPVSSTEIRRAVAEGKVQEASEMLGHPFALTGTIQTGCRARIENCFPYLESGRGAGTFAGARSICDGVRRGRTQISIGDERRRAANVRRAGAFDRKPFIRFQRTS